MEKYFRSWQDRDLVAMRACLADEILFDWGTVVYTDPDAFVAASESGIEWRDVTMRAAVYSHDAAAIVYEAVNVTDGLRVRTAEFLRCGGGRIREAIVVFTVIGRDV